MYKYYKNIYFIATMFDKLIEKVIPNRSEIFLSMPLFSLKCFLLFA